MERRPNTDRAVAASRAAVAGLAERFARERHDALAAVARRNGVTDDAIEDVVQAGLLGFIQSFRGDPDDERGAWTYLCRAVQTRAWRLHRTAKRRPVDRSLDEEAYHGGRAPTLGEVVPDREGVDPLERTIAADELAERRVLIEQLPTDWRAVLVLGALGYGVAEIAQVTGMSERQVRKRVQKAHARLAALLEE